MMSHRKKRISLFGGSFNPPGAHHREIALALGHISDEVIVFPCGPRPDKPDSSDVESIYRAALVDLAFREIPKTRVDLSDLEENTFTRTIDLDHRFAGEGEVWHVVGADLVFNGGRGKSEIQKSWVQGKRLWKEARFIVITRPGFVLPESDLPPHHQLLNLKLSNSSSGIRSLLLHGKSVENLVSEEVGSFIARHGLYRGTRSRRTTHLKLGEVRPLILSDSPNREAEKIAKSLPFKPSKTPNVIVAVGGDGFMLRTIRRHWRMRLPFLGINAGHLGFLLNDAPSALAPNRELTLHQLPLLWVETEDLDGKKLNHLAFNDAWVERATGQTAWIQIRVNGKERIRQLMADAALVATAAGSASYARAMGAPALPFNTPALLLAGSNVLRPAGWKSAVLPLDSWVEFVALEPKRRPLNAFIDGLTTGPVHKMRVRLSRAASVELVFDPRHDPAEKLAKIQFPTI